MKLVRSSLGLLSILCLAACGTTDSGGGGPESLLRFFPQETSGVIFVAFGDLREHAFLSSLLEENPTVQTPEQLDEFEAATGFDFENDVRRIMGGAVSGGGGLIVVDASYDLERVIQYLTDEGMRFGEQGSVALFRPNPSEQGVLAFIDDVVLVGREEDVRGAIDRTMAPMPTALDNPQLLADIREVEDGYQVWATGRIDDGLIPDEIGEAGPAQLLASLERGTYQMRIDDLITARATGEFTTAEQARTAANLLEGLRGIAMVQGAAGEFADLLSGILIASNDRRVELQLQVETAVLEELAESGALSR